jgi:hemerythrin-like metal-binding protein
LENNDLRPYGFVLPYLNPGIGVFFILSGATRSSLPNDAWPLRAPVQGAQAVDRRGWDPTARLGPRPPLWLGQGLGPPVTLGGMSGWDPNTFGLGLPELDAQHEAMHDLLFSLGREEGAREAALRADLQALRRISAAHFRLEEQVMAQVGYPDQVAHAHIHADLLQSLDAMIARAEAGRLPATEATFSYFRSWVLDHFQGEDQRLAAFLSASKP